MRSFAIITVIALTGVFITHFLNQSQNQLEIQQKAENSVYQNDSEIRLRGNSRIGKELSLQK